MDADYDFPIGAARRFRSHLLVFAVVAVIATTAIVAWIGWKFAGLPIAAAVALGGIVAPPDAAAATAVLRAVSIPRAASTILSGESLFNDATALLIFSGAIAVLSNGTPGPGVILRLTLAIPGGLLLGVGCALAFQRIIGFVKNTLGGNLLQFVVAFLMWIVAEHLRVSAVLCTIAFAMTIARNAEVTAGTRMRVQSFAVWSAVVFTLNVFAFLLMGLQGRTVVARMPAGHLRDSLAFTALVVLAAVATRLVIVIGFNRLNAWWEAAHHRRELISWRQAIFEGWSGMRGFVTLATAIALPAAFPQRDLAVLTAFSVVLATLVIQGLTLAPLIRLLKLEGGDARKQEIANGRSRLANAAVNALDGRSGAEAESIRYGYLIQREAANDPRGSDRLNTWRDVGLTAISSQREELERMRSDDVIGSDTYLLLQEELDWSELTLLCDDERRIDES